MANQSVPSSQWLSSATRFDFVRGLFHSECHLCLSFDSLLAFSELFFHAHYFVCIPDDFLDIWPWPCMDLFLSRKIAVVNVSCWVAVVVVVVVFMSI